MRTDSAIRQRKAPGTDDRLPADLHPVIRRVLLARNVHDAPGLSLEMSRMLTPADLSGIEQAASLLAEGVVGRKRILIVGDFDADGATGTALAVLSLRAMGCDTIDYRVPNRFEFGYGLTVPLVDTLAADPPDLLITVDSGISCIAGVARARELGCKVIVTDHHLPGEVLPQANAIVNPNCSGDGFPSKALAGVGVMFYLLSVVRRTLREQGWFTATRPEPRLADFLDLVALGTVADLVPLDHNNRVLIRQGIERIRRGVSRPGLLALLRLGKGDYRHVTASDLGFKVGPRLNAAGRLEDMSIGIQCLLCEDADAAMGLAAQLDELNKQRKGMQQQMQEEAQQKVQELILSLSGQDLPSVLCLFDPDWHQGIVGLVASRVKDGIHLPVVAFAPESEGSGLLKGSARSVRGLHIRDVLAYVDSHSPGLMKAYGGHAMAAGLTMESKNLPAFEEIVAVAADEVLGGEKLFNEILTDGELTNSDISLDMALALEDLGPWGQRFPEPLFDGLFEVLDHRVVGGAHLKMVLRPMDGGQAVDAIAFNRLPEDLKGNSSVRMLYRLDVNRWRNSQSCQLIVERIV
jgi:single-stranded-DNA-specific exonuclease